MSEPSRPPQEPAAKRLAARVDDRSPLAAILRDLARLDLAIYRSIAATPTPARGRSSPTPDERHRFFSIG